MSLFKKQFSGLSQQSQSALSPQEAFATITLISVATDGYFSNEEVLSLISTLNRMHLFRSYPSDVMQRMFDKLLSLIQRNGFDSMLKLAIQSLPHELAETVFAISADLVLADGEVTREEEALLNALYQSLRIGEQRASMIVDVMIVKNRG